MGLLSLKRRRLRDDLITAFNIFKGLLDIDPNLFFLPPAQRGLRGHPFKVLQGSSHRRIRGSAFSMRIMKHWNKLPASVVTGPSVNVFKEQLEKVWTKVFPHLNKGVNTDRASKPEQNSLFFNVSICYPTPCFTYVVFT